MDRILLKAGRMACLLLVLPFCAMATVTVVVGTVATGDFTDATYQEGKVTLSMKNAPLRAVLDAIEEQAGVRLMYDMSAVNEEEKVSITVRNATVEELLKQLFGDKALKWSKKGNVIRIRRAPVIRETRPEAVISQDTLGSVSGIVSDTSGMPLPGVSVIVKGKGNGTTTDLNGRYELPNVAKEEVLVFSFLGYKTQEVTVNGRKAINIALQVDIAGLDEVVVVGYGTVKKSDLTGSVSQVKAEEINAFPATNVLQAISGRAPGVQVLQNTGSPGAGISVRIRGTSSIQGSSEPLYVIDGFPISGSNPTILNNADIESIEVLKDASATAIYGSRGANGVVLITTKGGAQGKTKVDFETSYSSQSLIRKLDLMNATEYALFQNEIMRNDNLTPYFTQDQIDSFGEGFDWQDLIFRKAPMKTMTLNVNGGNDKTRFSISGSLFNQEGIVKGSDYNRYSFRTNVNHEVSKKISVNLSATLTRLQSSRKNSGGGNRGGSMIAATVSSPPTLTPYNEDGTYRDMLTAYPFISNSLRNPIIHINETMDQSKTNMVLSNFSVIYKPIPELAIKVSGGVENTDGRGDAYTTTNFMNSKGSASVSANQYTSLLSENTISYNNTFNGIHSISAVAGFTYQNFFSTGLSGSGSGFLSNTPETHELESAATPGIPGTNYSKSVLESYLARINYAFDNKYLITVSARADGSSKYSEGNKWGYFPSAAVAWRVSQEEFLRDAAFISDLKLRASWGKTGSQAIGAYATLNQLYSGKTTFDKNSYTTFAPGTRLPGDLRWETTEQADVGVDLGILENRIRFTADYYIKNTTDLLNTVVLPPTSGFTSTIQNVGEVQNKGLELGVDAIVSDKAVKWDISANISFNRNKVVKLYDGIDVLGGSMDVNAIQDYSNILREGKPIGQFWGYLEDGYTDAGQIEYKDMDGEEGITINDKTYIGNPNPDFIYGFNMGMGYKNLELRVFVQGVSGNDLLNYSSINNTVDYGIGLNMPREVYLDHWTPSNTSAKYPIPSISTRVRMSDRFVEDGSYLRLKNIELAYNLPVKDSGVDWIRNIQIYASAQNLLTFTNYSWWDPEVNSLGGTNSVTQGIDYFSYPTAKTITIGIRAGF